MFEDYLGLGPERRRRARRVARTHELSEDGEVNAGAVGFATLDAFRTGAFGSLALGGAVWTFTQGRWGVGATLALATAVIGAVWARRLVGRDRLAETVRDLSPAQPR